MQVFQRFFVMWKVNNILGTSYRYEFLATSCSYCILHRWLQGSTKECTEAHGSVRRRMGI